MRSSKFWRSRHLLLTASTLGTLVIAGCGASSGGGNEVAGNAPKISTAGVPKPLAANIRQANVILDGKGDLLAKKLRQLRGRPVVVNQWASWCDPCRFEFPFFRSAAVTYEKQVAFLGIDMQDSKGPAKKFLEDLPVPFPSIFDPDASYISSLGGGRVSPTTVFISRKGKPVQVHEGAYASLNVLEADIQTFAKPNKKA